MENWGIVEGEWVKKVGNHWSQPSFLPRRTVDYDPQCRYGVPVSEIMASSPFPGGFTRSQACAIHYVEIDVYVACGAWYMRRVAKCCGMKTRCRV